MHLNSHSKDQVLREVLNFNAMSNNIEDPLQILCLLSFVDGDISNEAFITIRKEFVEKHGLEAVLKLQALQRAGFLKEGSSIIGKMTSTSYFKNISKKLELVDPDIFEKNPKGKIFPYFGYKPLFGKILELSVLGEWNQPNFINRLSEKVTTHGNPSSIIENCRSWKSEDKGIANLARKKKILIILIGGATYAELAAMREIGRNLGLELLFIVSRILNFKIYLQELIN